MEECVQLVQEKCDWANIANVNVDGFTGFFKSATCFCQKGNDLTSNDTSSNFNCWFGETEETNGMQSGDMFYTQSIFECFIDSHIL